MLPKSARELARELDEKSSEQLRAWRAFGDKFFVDVFKGSGNLDSLPWDRLSRRELCCLILRYYPFPERPSGLTYEELGSLFRVSRERVRQIVQAAIQKLKRQYYKGERRGSYGARASTEDSQ